MNAGNGLLAVTLFGLTVGCGSISGPRDAIRYSADHVPGVTLSVSVRAAPTTTGPTGLEIKVVNNTSQRIQIGVQCGPPVDVILQGQRGIQTTLIQLMGDLAFPCMLTEDSFVSANTSRLISMELNRGLPSGGYRASAALRRADGLSNVSPPTLIEIR